MAEERDEELDRIIRRAQQLDEQPAEVVDHDALIDAAAEAGISPEAMRHSVAIERLGPADFKPHLLLRFWAPHLRRKVV